MAAVARGIGAAPRSTGASCLCFWAATRQSVSRAGPDGRVFGASIRATVLSPRFGLGQTINAPFLYTTRRLSSAVKASSLSTSQKSIPNTTATRPTAPQPPSRPQSPATTVTTPTSTTKTRDAARTSPISIHDVSASAYAAALATRDQPTLIYEAPSHALMFTAYWTGAAMMMATMSVPAVLVLSTPTDGLSEWVLPAYYVILLSSWFIGAGIVYAGAGTVKKITALSSIRARVRQVHAETMGAPLWFEIEVKRVLPFRGPYTLRAPVQRIQLEPGSLAAMLAIPRSEWERLRIETEQAAEAEAKYDAEHPYTLPLRKVWRAITGFWRDVVYAISRREFSKLKVDKKQLQIHTTGGWALEDGLALERLFGGDKFKMRD